MALWDWIWNKIVHGESSPPQPENAGAIGTAVAEHDACESVEGDRWWSTPETSLTQPIEFVAPERSPEGRLLENLLVGHIDDQDFKLPTLPKVPGRVLQQLASSDWSAEAIANDIAEDQVLAAAVLRTANSPFYRGTDRIESLRPAVVRLGGKVLHTLMLNQSMRALAFGKRGTNDRWAKIICARSQAAGYIMRGLARLSGLDEERALLIGLVHNIGNVIILHATHMQTAVSCYEVEDDEFEAICFEWHQDFGNLIADTWQLPEDLKALIADHHRYPEADDPLHAERMQLELTDMICARIEYTPYQPYDLLGCRAARDLGVADQPAFGQFLDRLPDALEETLASL